MHYEDIVKPIYESFLKHKETFELSGRHTSDSAIKAAFYQAICYCTEQFFVENTIDHIILKEGGDDYSRHIEEKTGLKIGDAINKNPVVQDIYIENSPMGRRTRKTVCLIKINRYFKGE